MITGRISWIVHQKRGGTTSCCHGKRWNYSLIPRSPLTPVLNGCSRQNGGEPGVSCHMICNTVIKNWSRGRPGDKAYGTNAAGKGWGYLLLLGWPNLFSATTSDVLLLYIALALFLVQNTNKL